MITTMKYLPLLIASTVMMGSVLYKVLSPELQLTYLARDVILFFILYYVIRRVTFGIEKILRNYWKIL
ncbi:MAG: hypothetical protein LBV04_04100 [Deferribacteraceae bacterium]|jgi:hypothetical protein|nr:hypothetical protein [Deferribacteraceae bacterium]